MTNLDLMCCICMIKSDDLVLLDATNSSDVKYLKKLLICVPNETWHAQFKLCPLCASQLDVAYQFVLGCIESERYRKVPEDCDKFKCDECGKSFRQKKYLSQHITKLHSNQKETDDELKPNIEALKEDDNDKENDDNFKYEPEDEEEDSEDDLIEKPSKKRSYKRQPLKCTICNELFRKRQDWMLHMRLRHEFEKPFACDQCDAKYMNRYSLLIHSRKHKNEKPFVCDSCGKSFVSSADLNHHTKIHNDDRAYPCPICGRSFKTHSNLRTHRIQMHLDPADWKFSCNLCEKKFPIRGNLMKHLKRHAGIKEFDCHICEKKFVNKAELSLHLNTHTNQRLFKCTVCGKDYKNREGLRRHMKVVHDQGNWKAPKQEKKYMCPMCPKIFAFGNKLQRHIFTHTGEKPYKCDYCQKRFIDNYGRKVHYKKDHNVEC